MCRIQFFLPSERRWQRGQRDARLLVEPLQEVLLHLAQALVLPSENIFNKQNRTFLWMRFGQMFEKRLSRRTRDPLETREETSSGLRRRTKRLSREMSKSSASCKTSSRTEIARIRERMDNFLNEFGDICCLLHDSARSKLGPSRSVPPENSVFLCCFKLEACSSLCSFPSNNDYAVRNFVFGTHSS